jgi:hypothetical protein
VLVATGAGAEVTAVGSLEWGASAGGRPMLRAATTPAPISTSSSSHHHERPPPPRGARATRRRPCATLAEYRPAMSPARAQGCYKRFTATCDAQPLDRTSLVGPSVSMPIQHGRLVLGRWQAVYFCEFDGPRQRTIQIQVIGERGSLGGES